MPKRVRVNYGFTDLSDGNLSKFAGGVIDNLTEHSVSFPDLPHDVAALTTFKTDFDNARAAQVDAGPSATAAKNNYREILVDALRDDAGYVELQANNDLAVLLSSGYQAVSTNRAQAPLEQVEIISISNAESGKLKVRPKPQRNVRSFVGRIKPTGSEYGPSISFASSRDIIFGALVAGVKYTLQLAAIGGSTGQSDWSDPIEKIVTYST